MNRVFLIMIACCFFAANVFGQAPARAENPNAPEISFEKIEHDFGTKPLNSDVEYEFTFTNTGKEPLIIQNCRATCGCTVPVCPNEKPVLPGEKGSIKVRYSTTSYAHPFDRSFTVTTNAKNSSVTLKIKGVISQEAETAAK